MEDIPPSYDFAVSRDPWTVVAPWLPSAELCSAMLVSRKWNTVFAPFLWGNPTSHFGTDNDAVYVALTRFRRILRRARPGVRQLTHTLHLPPALSEIYGGPNAFWLRDVLEYLPNLQSLIISQLPFFDHNSLLALRHPSAARHHLLANEDDRMQYDLKLLLAEREPNTTSAGIKEALLHFLKLVYLDLSYTTPARDLSVLSSVGNLWDLQVLKLRGIGLRDHELSILAKAIGIRVRLLDIRDNQLTDATVVSLTEACFLPPDRLLGDQARNAGHGGDWPIGIPPGPDFLSLDSLRSEDLDRQLIRQLTHPLTGRLAFEDLPHKGLTHLYISGNGISYRGLAKLLRTKRLHVLDGGSAQKVQTKTQQDHSPNQSSLPDAKELCLALIEDARSSLTYLRVHYSILTETMLVPEAASPATSKSPISESAMNVAELDSEQPAIFEAPAPARYPVELASENDAIFELSGEPVSSSAQHPHDVLPSTPPPPIDSVPAPKYVMNDGESLGQAKRGDGVFAPEPVPVSDLEPDQRGSRISTIIRDANDRASSLRSAAIAAQIEHLIAKRPLRQAVLSTSAVDVSHHPAEFSLHPSHLTHLKTLILTDVPSQNNALVHIVEALKKFISACAEENHLAELRAQAKSPITSGHSRGAPNRQYVKSSFALETIVLEVDPRSSIGSTRKAWDHSHARQNMLRSSTGDVDSEALWTAAENDFSFFGEAGEEEDECGIPSNEPDKYYPTAAPTDEKIICDPTVDNIPTTTTTTSHAPSPHLIASFPPPSSPSSPPPLLTPSPILLQSPRNLPLGRNRRAGNSPRQSTLTPPSPRKTSPSLLPHSPSPSPSPTSHPPAPPLDIVADLASFRRERKSAHEKAVTNWQARKRAGKGVMAGPEGESEPFTPGHWSGAIKIVRNAAPKGRSGVVDTYGNFFEKGYLYP